MKQEVTVPYKIIPGAVPMQCVPNCEEQVEREGGKVVVGWQVSDFGYFTSYVHHAVWEDPDGQLWEITPALLGFDGATLMGMHQATRFIADPKAEFVGEKPNRRALPTRYVPKHDDPALDRAADYLGRSDRAWAKADRTKGQYWQARAQNTINQFAKRTQRPLICLDSPPIPDGVTMGRESPSDVEYLDPQSILSSSSRQVG